MIHIYTCNCLLEHLTRLSNNEILKYIACHDIFYLEDKWIMFLCDSLSFYFFCLNTLRIMKKFTNETIFCLKRSGIFDDTCLDFMDFSGVNNCCSNCCFLLIEVFKKYLVKVKK